MATEPAIITPEIQAASQIRTNEFEAFVMRYGVPSDEGRIMESGSLSSGSGKLLVLHWEHSVPIGVAKLAELPGIGVFAHGRLAPLTATGLHVALLMQQGILKELCLSSKTIRASRATLTDGRQFVIVHEAEPVELSITLRCSIPGTGILKVGPLSLDQTEWDQKAGET